MFKIAYYYLSKNIIQNFISKRKKGGFFAETPFQQD